MAPAPPNLALAFNSSCFEIQMADSSGLYYRVTQYKLRCSYTVTGAEPQLLLDVKVPDVINGNEWIRCDLDSNAKVICNASATNAVGETRTFSSTSIVLASVVPSLTVLVIVVLITGVVFYKHRTQNSTRSSEESSAFACVAGSSTAECRPHSTSRGNKDTSTNVYEELRVSKMSQQANNKAYQNVLLTDQSVETQFERLERAVAQIRFDYSTAQLPLNIEKNRCADILPTAQHAVTVYGTDYINAVFVNSFLQENQFIATQLPLSHTTSDFWKMIHERKVNVVVQLLPQMLDYFPDADGDEFYLDWGEMQRDDSSENSLVQLVHLTVEDRSVSVVKVQNWSDNQQEGNEMPKISSLLYYFQVVDSYVDGGSICVTDT
ncbi:receptor-type tyrosine-protein phosphatase alpha-like [Watersipora subatra]|uniref:receptor-type tyrosine-protein phosphatase alpha-like n=1 Tax=Watersipora subatra TaxID=2589382 RepID=UPI00355C307A